MTPDRSPPTDGMGAHVVIGAVLAFACGVATASAVLVSGIVLPVPDAWVPLARGVLALVAGVFATGVGWFLTVLSLFGRF